MVKLFSGDPHFKYELVKQMKFLIIVTLGFTIAFSWRQTIFDATQTLVEYFIKVDSSITLSILTSSVITIVSVVIIFVTAKLLKTPYKI